MELDGSDPPIAPSKTPATPDEVLGLTAKPPAAIEIQKRYIHSDIYDRLVAGDDDLPGLVAYGLYQSAKRRWINAFEKTHHRTPSE